MEYAIVISAGTVSAAFLYAVLTNGGNIESIKAQLSLQGINLDMTFFKPPGGALLSAAAGGPVNGSVKLKNPVDFAKLQTALDKAVNKVDETAVGTHINVIVKKLALTNGDDHDGTLVPYGDGVVVDSVSLRSAAAAAADGNTYGVKMFNHKETAMFPQLFQGFIANPTDGVSHVPWKVSQFKISGSQSVTTSWTIQYGVCYGQTGADGGFAVSDGKPCKLGDVGTLAIVDGQPVLTISSDGGSPGAITCSLPPGFPDNFYIGFGVIPPGGTGQDIKPTGVTKTSAGMSTVFTPKQTYSVNFTTSKVDMGLYTEQAFSQFASFDWTGTIYNYETCTFNQDGNWTLVASTVSFLKSGKISGLSGVGSEDNHNYPEPLYGAEVRIPTNRLSKLAIEYFE